MRTHECPTIRGFKVLLKGRFGVAKRDVGHERFVHIDVAQRLVLENTFVMKTKKVPIQRQHNDVPDLITRHNPVLLDILIVGETMIV